jgi:hypothetical protein
MANDIISAHLPSEALKAILAFMKRKQLMVLSRVSRQYHSVVNSPPCHMKPLLRIPQLTMRRSALQRGCVGMVTRPNRMKGSLIYGNAALNALLQIKWLRIDCESSTSGVLRLPFRLPT